MSARHPPGAGCRGKAACGREAIGHLISTVPLEELGRRLRRVDAAVLDLDGSIHRGITQGAVAFNLIGRLAFLPERPADRRCLPGVLAAGAALAGLWILPGHRQSRHFNRRMIALWCRSFRGVPMSYFRLAASRIPRRSYPGVRETVEALARRGPVAIVSVGLEVVVGEYLRQFARAGVPVISACACNRMVREVRGGREVFAGRYAEPIIATPAEKAAAGERFFRRVGARCPLVVGNDEGDVLLARLARERGGLAVGVRPPRRIRSEFDARLTRGDWRPLAALLA